MMRWIIAASLLLPFSLAAQTDAILPLPAPSENWNLYYQATSIGQHHGTFNSPYEGPLSLQDYPERDVSLTTTLFFGLRLGQGTQLDLRSRNRGRARIQQRRRTRQCSQWRTAASRYRHSQAVSRAALHLARLRFRRREWSTWRATRINWRATVPMIRYTITAGRFSDSDFFDDNNYSHDPRTQFMAWGMMYNGAWDYPADTRGYTWGIVNEFHTRNWSFRYGVAAEPRVANGGRFDRRLFVDQGQTFEEERRFSIGESPGAIRWLQYLNRTRSGSYVEAVRLAEQTGTTPVVQAIRRPGTLKYGTGISFDQELYSRRRESSRGWAGTTARPKTLHSPPSIGWRKAACR